MVLRRDIEMGAGDYRHRARASTGLALVVRGRGLPGWRGLPCWQCPYGDPG